jgi:hypothetical protein
MSKAIAKVWTFGSSSNPNKSYETLQYTDGSTSCNCPGWTRRVAGDGSRSCTHTRKVDQGIADQHATSFSDYTQKSSASQGTATSNAPAKKNQTAKDVFSPAPSRKVQWQ